MTIGRKIATTAVLLNKPDIGAAINAISKICNVLEFFAIPKTKCPIFCITPVLATPPESMNIQSTVIVAELAKPDTP